MNRRLTLALLLLFTFVGACDVEMGSPLPAPRRIICLDFTNSGFDPDWQEQVYRKMDEDFSPHGFRVKYIEPTDCEFTIEFGGDDASRWGVAFESQRRARVFTLAILRYADGLEASAYLQGVSNAAAHEMGHLLGREHVEDTTDVMSVPSASIRFFDNLKYNP